VGVLLSPFEVQVLSLNHTFAGTKFSKDQGPQVTTRTHSAQRKSLVRPFQVFFIMALVDEDRDHEGDSSGEVQEDEEGGVEKTLCTIKAYSDNTFDMKVGPSLPPSVSALC